MSCIVQLDSPGGRGYSLDGQPLTNGDLIEVYRWDEWHRGKFAAHEDPQYPPWFFTTGHGFAIPADAPVRWVDVEPSPPPVIDVNEPKETLKDWERRA